MWTFNLWSNSRCNKTHFQTVIPELVKRCLHGHNQNSDKFLNNMNWSQIPPPQKKICLWTLKLGVHIAIITFKDDKIGRIKLLKHLGVEPSYNILQAFQEMDSVIIWKSDRRSQTEKKEYKLIWKNQKVLQMTEFAVGCSLCHRSDKIFFQLQRNFLKIIFVFNIWPIYSGSILGTKFKFWPYLHLLLTNMLNCNIVAVCNKSLRKLM